MNMNRQVLSVPMKRCSKAWLFFRLVSIAYLGLVLLLVLHKWVPPLRRSTLLLDAMYSLVNAPLGIVFGLSLSILITCLLIRSFRRVCQIDSLRGILFVPYLLCGYRRYFFAEVESVEFEADMSEALLKLECRKFCRVYLRLQNNKLLLISESKDEKALLPVAEEMSRTLEVPLLHVHRVGRSRGHPLSLGRYVISKELSHGGMGKVFLAREADTGRKVALKVLPVEKALDNHSVTRFARETNILKSLAHKSIVKIYEVGRERSEEGEFYFYAMEFIEGVSLQSLINAGELTFRRSAYLTFQVALALDYIHQHKVIHRDIKPSNIMVHGADEITLIDFGIAHRTEAPVSPGEHSKPASANEISHYVGTPPYMSPEQINMEARIDHRTDIYSLGVTFYQMLTGVLPFKGSATTVYDSVRNWEPPRPRRHNPDIPPELEIIVLRAMRKDRSQRYQTAGAMAEDLNCWLRGIPIIIRRPPWWQRLWHWLIRHEME